MEKNYDVGDKVKIKTTKEEIEGILLESHEPGVFLIKLDSGYNIGIKKEDVVEVKLAEKAKKSAEKEEFKLSGKKPIVDLIICGGTISSSLDSKTGAVKWVTKPEDLFRFYPEIFDLCDIRIINPFMKASENMSSPDWIKIAKQVVKSLNEDNVHGVIITHGTDFLHYTASALSFFLKNVNKPVILTYSQRSTDRGSSDAELNLYCSAKAALSDIAEVMLVGHASSNDDFCYALQGNKCRKMHSSSRDAFKPINCSPIAKIYKDKIEVLRNYNKKKTGKENKAELDAVFEEKIAVVKFYPGQSPEILEHYAKEGYRGVVIEMSGLGHVLTEGKNDWLPTLKRIIEKGMIVCAAGQTIYGRLDPLVYSPGRELKKVGVIYLGDMLSETAFVKLGWVLGKTNKRDEVEKLMLQNIAGEFNERLVE